VTPRSALALLLAVLAGMALIAFTRFDVSTDITNMMPSGSEGTLAAVSRELTRSELARTMLLSIGADTTEQAVAAARELADALRARDDVAWVRGGIDDDQMRAVYELYFPRRHAFLTDRPEELPALLSDAGLARAAEELKRELASPVSPLTKKVAPADPLGAFRGVVERFRGTQPALAVRDGWFVSPDGRHAIVMLGTKASAFDAKAQREFLSALRGTFDGIAARAAGPLVLESSGANKISVEAERSIKADVRLVAVVGTVLVAVLLLAFFPSPASFVMVALPSVAGILVATGTGMLVFGKLDGLTMGFGAALIGVVIDYPTHLLTHLVLAPRGWAVRDVVRHHRGAIRLGGLTTIASFVGLGLTSFRGFQQIALFSVVGVFTAIVVTLYVLPGFWRIAERPPRVAAWAAARIGVSVDAAAKRRGILVALTVASLLAGLPALTGLRWVDDLTKLWRMDPALQAEDERVRARVAQADAGRVVIALAEDRDAAVRANDAVAARLGPLVASGDLAGIRSLHSFLWARDVQERNLAAVASDPTLPARVDRVFGAAGFRPGAFDAFARDLAAPQPEPLGYDALLASPVADLVRSMLVQLGDDVGAITYLSGVRDEAAVRAAVADLPRVHYFDQKTFLNEIYTAFRTTTVEQIFVGNALVIALLLLRYRSVRLALAAYFPSVLVAIVLLGAYALLGVDVNLLHTVSIVIVTGMGVDYGVFVVDAARQRESLGPTMLSVCVCALTTTFTFGVMALSRHPALQAIGVTIGIGVLLSFLLAPLALLLLPRTGEVGGSGGAR
jgi:predicted exporter